MKTKYQLLFCLLILLSSCQRQQDWLDVKVERNSVVPGRISDFQALLDGDFLFQQHSLLSLLSSDAFYLTDAVYNGSSSVYVRNGYIWAKEIYEGQVPIEWRSMYQLVAVANICLEGIEKISVTPQNQLEHEQVRGMAHFYRGLAFYNLLQYFAPPYDANTANTDLGIPLRLYSDVNDRPGRSSVAACYEQVISDLKAAESLLPMRTSSKIRAGQAAVKGLLARVYQTLENWEAADQYATAALNIESTLVDFNSLNANTTLPFPTLQNNHPEVIYYAESMSSSIYLGNNAMIDSVLYRSYANNDLRRTMFFRIANGLPYFKGYYTGRDARPFEGIATNELYLIAAEAKARKGDVTGSMQRLNQLLIKRWRTGTYQPLQSANAETALRLVLSERKKEFPFTGNLIWLDLRRLNKDPRFARTLKRIVGGIVYELPPNDARYTFAIPDIEVQLTGIPQNKR